MKPFANLSKYGPPHAILAKVHEYLFNITRKYQNAILYGNFKMLRQPPPHTHTQTDLQIIYAYSFCLKTLIRVFDNFDFFS